MSDVDKETKLIMLRVASSVDIIFSKILPFKFEVLYILGYIQ